MVTLPSLLTAPSGTKSITARAGGRRWQVGGSIPPSSFAQGFLHSAPNAKATEDKPSYAGQVGGQVRSPDGGISPTNKHDRIFGVLLPSLASLAVFLVSLIGVTESFYLLLLPPFALLQNRFNPFPIYSIERIKFAKVSNI